MARSRLSQTWRSRMLSKSAIRTARRIESSARHGSTLTLGYMAGIVQRLVRRQLDFICIGAQKAGTTALWRYLSDHPQLEFPSDKAATFFAVNARYERGVEWFLREFFPDADPGAGGAPSHRVIWVRASNHAQCRTRRRTRERDRAPDSFHVSRRKVARAFARSD